MQKNLNNTIQVFSANLFWDVDRNDLDMDKNKRFIIQRVLEYGTLSDWRTIKKKYGIDCIGKEMRQVRSLDNHALSFISMVTNTKKEDFRCYTSKQLLPQHWDF